MGPSAFTDGEDYERVGWRHRHVASMGPSAFTDGETWTPPATKAPAPMLQWGRRPSPTESRGSCRRLCRWGCFNGAVGLHRRRGGAGRRAHLPRAADASMGPSAFTDGEFRNCRNLIRTLTLQWGRRPSPTESRPVVHLLDGMAWLQWGRRPSPTERVPRLHRGANRGGASMGPSAFTDGEPRAFSCFTRRNGASMGPSAFTDGELSIPHHFSPISSSFNGAVGLHRRRAGRSWSRGVAWPRFNGAVGLHRRRGGVIGGPSGRRTLLQWGRRPSPTERRRPEAACLLTESFNGAVGLHRRRAPCPPGRQRPGRAGFNGAVGLHRRRGDAEASFTTATRRRFNGAVGLHRRRDAVRMRAPACSSLLQWGRRPSPTERGASFNDPNTLVRLQWGRRPSPTESRTSTRYCCISHVLQWGRRRRRDDQDHDYVSFRLASMGPSAFTDGEGRTSSSRSRTSTSCFNGAVGLHRRRDVETAVGDSEVRVASMGPSAFTDGETACAHGVTRRRTGFNGAVGLHRRRARELEHVLHLCRWLQWGRRPSPTERAPRSRVTSDAAVKLQWGRRPSPTERSADAGRASRRRPRFNGAVGLHRRRGRGPAALARRRSVASMGPSAFTDGEALPTRGSCHSASCFNGAVGLHRRRAR